MNVASSLCVGDLIAAQKFLPDGVEAGISHIRIHTQRVAVPDVHLGTGQWLHSPEPRRNMLQCQHEWRTGFDLPGRRV